MEDAGVSEPIVATSLGACAGNVGTWIPRVSAKAVRTEELFFKTLFKIIDAGGAGGLFGEVFFGFANMIWRSSLLNQLRRMDSPSS